MRAAALLLRSPSIILYAAYINRMSIRAAWGEIDGLAPYLQGRKPKAR